MTEPMREGLPPVIGDGARVLVLGSFPSERSLATGEYYANPGNRFWLLLGTVLGFDADTPYPDRIDAVKRHGIALWDVVHSCRRAGSMDAAIDRKTLIVNDFCPLFERHPGIERVFANGVAALEVLERHTTVPKPVIRLPSSSGALPMSFADRLVRWREIG